MSWFHFCIHQTTSTNLAREPSDALVHVMVVVDKIWWEDGQNPEMSSLDMSWELIFKESSWDVWKHSCQLVCLCQTFSSISAKFVFNSNLKSGTFYIWSSTGSPPPTKKKTTAGSNQSLHPNDRQDSWRPKWWSLKWRHPQQWKRFSWASKVPPEARWKNSWKYPPWN